MCDTPRSVRRPIPDNEVSMTRPGIQIVGAGPAGTAAAIAAQSEGAAVRLIERSPAPRHKVCGEFIPAEACMALQELGVWPDFLRHNPARIRRCALHWGSRTKRWNFEEPAYSLSRLELDRLLLDRALSLGAQLTLGESFPVRKPATTTLILANGRHHTAPKSQRLFGFKAHFEGPVDDAVELYFTPVGYFGVSPIENGFTNVCGLAPEDLLAHYHFDIDAFVQAHAALAGRLRPLSRRMSWLKVGPLVFSPVPSPVPTQDRVYHAGDALTFVDPFTGSGILNALLTGRQAGIAAARQMSREQHLRACRDLLGRPFAVSSLLRFVLRARVSALAQFVPGPWLYRMTRPHPVSTLDA